MKNDVIELAVLRLFCSTEDSRQTLWYPYGEGTVGERPRDVSYGYDSNGVLHLPEY